MRNKPHTKMKGLPKFFIVLFFLISSCSDSGKPIKKSEIDKFDKIVLEMLKDTNYILIEKKKGLLNYDDPIISVIKLCCSDTQHIASMLKGKIQVSTALLKNKELYANNPTRYGTSIELTQWIVQDSIILNHIKDLVNCSRLIRCGVHNTYEPLFLGDRVFFSWIYDYDHKTDLKDPLIDVRKLYGQN